jgi:hypothetical protein
MTAERWLVFFHVACAIGMVLALMLEWLSVRGAARAGSVEQARVWARLSRALLPVGLPATLGSLGTGIALGQLLGAWELGWVRIAVPCLVAIAVAGALVGRRRTKAFAALEGGETLEASQRALGHPVLELSLRFRTALLVALLFEMTARPDGPLAWIILVAAAGLAGASVFAGRPGPYPGRPTPRARF